VAERRAWIEPGHRGLSVRRQCELLGLHRSNLYYEPVPESAENLALMRLIDEEYLRHPFLGSRGMVLYLEQQGEAVNRKKVRRLLRKMGLQSVAPQPRTTIWAAGHAVHPYQCAAWRSCDRTGRDITYGCARYLYSTAVMDWFSRYVLSWRLSNSLTWSLPGVLGESARARSAGDLHGPGIAVHEPRSSRAADQGIDRDQHGRQRPRD
jgi:putative transposase